MKRKGFSTAEALVVILLSLILFQGALRLLAGHFSILATTTERVTALEARRQSSLLIRRESISTVPGIDFEVVSEEEWRGRVFRGVGFVCRSLVPNFSGGRVPVYSLGIRKANPQKDSLLVLNRDGRWGGHLLLSRTPVSDVCPEAPGRDVEVWRVEPAPEGPIVIQFFERGSYHISGAALRYRQGAGGRQPITPEIFDDRESGFLPFQGGRFGLALSLSNSPDGNPYWREPLIWPWMAREGL